MKPFNCWKCGACCRLVGLHPEGRELDRGDGACKHLLEDNTCAIYESRPDICNTSTMFERKWSKVMTWDQYLETAEAVCHKLDEAVNGATK